MQTADITRCLTTLFSELVDGAKAPVGGNFVHNSGDAGLVALLDKLSAADASRSVYAGPRLTMHPAPIDVAPADQKCVDQVRTAIEANLGDESFSVERLATEVGQSRGNLHRRLRELIGESPSDLIRRMRLERAAELRLQ